MLNNEANFWEAIDATPDDDAVRLVFADWLEERGDVRAALIRTRCLQIRRIKEKLARITTEDNTLSLFAAKSHRYQMHPPLPAATVRALEREFGVRFPEDHVDFLMRVAEGGAGPSYGLHPLRRACHVGMGKAFPFPTESNPERNPAAGHELAEEEEDKYWANHWVRSDHGWSTPSFRGCIALSDHGCASVSYLVITGKEQGVVWDFHGGGDGMWHPSGMTFLPWYEAWLDGALRRVVAAGRSG